MEISRELLFFFSALGAFNGIVLSLYFLFFAKPSHISNKFLGAFLLMISIRTGKSVFFFFNPDLSFHYLQFGLTACFFIGPFLYFYIKSILKPESNIKIEWKYHFVVLALIAIIIGFLYPFKTNVDFWRPYFIKTIYYSWFGYILLTGYQLISTFKKLFINKTKITSVEIWMLSIFFGNIAVWYSYTFREFTSYITGALTFTFLLYLAVLFLIFNNKKRSVLFNKSKKYSDKKINEQKASNLIEKLNTLMIDGKLYQNSNLKSSEIAKKLGLTKVILDGQQRLTSLYHCLTEFKGEDNIWDIYADLKTGKFLHLDKNETAKFHYFSLKKVLSTMDFLKECKKYMEDKNDEYLVEKAEILADTLRKYKISIIKMVGGEIEEAIEIFTRLNRTGLEILPFDVINALNYVDEGDSPLIELRTRMFNLISDSGFFDAGKEDVFINQIYLKIIRISCGFQLYGNKDTLKLSSYCKSNEFKNQNLHVFSKLGFYDHGDNGIILWSGLNWFSWCYDNFYSIFLFNKFRSRKNSFHNYSMYFPISIRFKKRKNRITRLPNWAKMV